MTETLARKHARPPVAASHHSLMRKPNASVRRPRTGNSATTLIGIERTSGSATFAPAAPSFTRAFFSPLSIRNAIVGRGGRQQWEKNDDEVPVNISKNRARGAVTGHHVRSVLAFGLVVALGLYFGLGVKPNAPPPLVSPPGSQGTPATGQ
jgi:hypothetical protein